MRVPAVLTAVVAAVMMVVPTASIAATAKGSHNVTFGAGPASKNKIDGRPYYTFDASPGASIDDEIGIINFAHKKQKLAVYTVDATSTTTGDFSYSPKAKKPVDAGSWLAVGSRHASGSVVVKARSKTFLPIRLRVPNNAQPGDHAAAVIVSLTGLVKGRSGQKVHLEQRVATRVVVRVSGTLNPQLTVENLKVHYKVPTSPVAKGTATVTYTVHNTGNAVLGATQQVEIKGLFGTKTRGAALPGIPALLPGGSIPVTANVPGVYPEIHMNATVHLVPAGLQGSVNPGIHEVTASTSFWAIPWLLILIVIVLILLVVGYVVRRRRRSQSPGRHRGTPPPAASPEGASS